MVEHHVEQGLDARAGQGGGGGADLGPASRGQPWVGRAEGDGVIAPIVGQPERRQMPLVDPGGDGEQLDAGHPQAFQMGDGRRMGEAGEGPAQGLGDVGVGAGEAPDVQLIDHRLVPGDPRNRRRGADGRREHHPLGHEGRAVGLAEHRRVQDERPVQRQGEGIDQQLGGIEPMPLRGCERTMGAQAVTSAFADALDMAVEHRAGAAGQGDAGELDLSFQVEQAELDAVGAGGMDSDVQAPGGQARAQRLG